jgi:hypothetical protein
MEESPDPMAGSNQLPFLSWLSLNVWLLRAHSKDMRLKERKEVKLIYPP